jgi:hypothetical protein
MTKKDKQMMEAAYSQVCENYMQFAHNQRMGQQTQNQLLDSIERINVEAKSKNLQQNQLYSNLSNVLTHIQTVLSRGGMPNFQADRELMMKMQEVKKILSTDQQAISQFDPRNIQALKQAIQSIRV